MITARSMKGCVDAVLLEYTVHPGPASPKDRHGDRTFSRTAPFLFCDAFLYLQHGSIKDGSPQTMTASTALIDPQGLAESAVQRGIERYLCDLEARIVPFVDRNFSMTGSLELHRRAVGLDLVRAPANVALAFPYLAARGAGALARAARAPRTAAWLHRQNPFLETDVGAELKWRLHVEFLGMPYASDTPIHRESREDRLAAMILSDPTLDAELRYHLEQIGRAGADPAFRESLTRKIETYTESRVAAAEMTTAILSVGLGAVAFKQITPSALSLGPVLATALAQHAAVAGVPLGASLGGAWFAVFPAATPMALTVAVTGGVLVAAAGLAAFAGVVADPVQRKLGFHHRKLRRLVASIGHELNGRGPHTLALRDHYVARVFDLIDIVRFASQSLR